MSTRTIVLKFDCFALQGANDLPAAVHEIYRWRRDGWGVIVAIGETHSAALMAVALDRVGIPAHVIDSPALADRRRTESRLAHTGVLVVSGFIDVALATLVRSCESIVGLIDCTAAKLSRPPRSLRVAILGLGVVGAGVFERLAAMPERFEIVGALVRDRQKHAMHARGIRLIDAQDDLPRLDLDVVVDALPGLEPSRALVRNFLSHGVSVVSANKVLIFDAGVQLESIADRSGASLLYSAAAGGSAPMIETLRREAKCGDIIELAGILNGTSNYILSRCADGASIDDATRAAQAAGFAEADPDEDVSGRDAARKLCILARIAFGREPDPVSIEPLNAATLAAARAALKPHETLRQVASAKRDDHVITGQVALRAVAADGLLGRTRDEFNTLIITRDDETLEVTGRGAGRWPTTEAMIGDMLELTRIRGST